MWSSWSEALIWFPSAYGDQDERSRKARLLEMAGRHDSVRLGESVFSYVRGELAKGDSAAEAGLVDPRWSEQLADTWAILLRQLTEAIIQLDPADDPRRTPSAWPPEESGGLDTSGSLSIANTDQGVANARRLWTSLLQGLYHADPQRAEALVRRVVKLAVDDGIAISLAATAASALIYLDPERFLREILTEMGAHTDAARPVARICSDRHDEASILGVISEADLGFLYRWLAELYTPETDRHRLGVHFVSPDEQARS
ncbi:MAG: hypothetical protein QOE61_2927, partial [Micromonosporaceae bacterium]|nr:hypothetical protein [Micromonosporaceae bacterium]